jgi:hypothetical protein
MPGRALLAANALPKSSVLKTWQPSQLSSATYLGKVYEGTYNPDKSYVVGNFITHDGSLWHCQMPSKGIEPGHAPSHFRLAVKRGRDAKEAK